MFNQPPLILNLRGRKLIGRVAFAFLLLSSITFGTAAGLLFVYASDLPEIRALEDYRPDVVTELYADDGQLVGSFALQRRILITYDQVPQVLKDAILVTEDQHFEEHWGIDFPRVAQAAWRNIVQRRKAGEPAQAGRGGAACRLDPRADLFAGAPPPARAGAAQLGDRAHEPRRAHQRARSAGGHEAAA